MTIEEKAKAYDEALKKIKMLLGSGSSCSREELEYVFPQLKESEYEKVRKEILQELKESEDSIILSPFKRERWIAWLESQGDKSETDVQEVYGETLFKIATVLSQHEDKEGSPLEKIREIMVDGSLSAMDVEEKNKKIEEKSVWNEEDKENISMLIDLVESKEESMEVKIELSAWLKALKDRVQPQPNPAWSKEDEKIYNLLYEEYKNIAHYSHSREKAEDIPGEVLGWLKSIKGRIQPKQEWSEEDEKMIGNIRRIIAQDAFYNDAVDVNGELCEKMYIDADNWLKLLKDRVGCEVDCITTKEWSEEDELMLNDILTCGERHCYLDASNIAWLKELKDRVQQQPK